MFEVEVVKMTADFSKLKNRSEQRKRSGLCTKCGAPAEKSNLCKKHYNEWHNGYLRDWRSKQLEKKKCRYCKDGEIYKAGMCRSHYEKHQEKSDARTKSVHKCSLCGEIGHKRNNRRRHPRE